MFPKFYILPVFRPCNLWRSLFNFRICNPSKNQQPKCKSGEVALFGDVIEPKTKSIPIDKDHFTIATALITNDDSRKINVGLKMIFG